MSIASSSGSTAVHIHRRKSSKEEDENVLVFPSSSPPVPTIGKPPAPYGGDSEKRMNGGGGLVANGVNGHGLSPKVNGNGASTELPDVPQRTRVTSNPSAPSVPTSPLPSSHSHVPHPPSAGPYRTSFAMHQQPPRSPHANGVASHLHPSGMNGHASRHQAPSMRQSLSLPAHSRTRSVSGPFSPSSPSPLAMSFPASSSTPPSSTLNPGHRRQGSTSSPQYPDLQNPFAAARSVSMSAATTPGVTPSSSMSSQGSHARRHSRLHSRNLSIFFPRPGSLPSTTIAEDGTQEVDFSSTSSLASLHTPPDGEGVLMPSVSSPTPGQRNFKEGFTFGTRRPEDPNAPAVGPGPLNAKARRGHHHKHSLSHNFFSFLEPGQNQDLITNPTLTPVSPWNPISPFPKSPSEDEAAHAHSHSHSPHEENHGHDDHSHSHAHDEHSHSHSHDDHSHSHSHSHPHSAHAHDHVLGPKSPIGSLSADPQYDTAAVAMSAIQFILGAALWVSGQQIGSLACTGLGYWVVFDSFGVALGKLAPSWLSRPSMKNYWRRPYGNARFETLLIYAQSIYLIFASVYVCKETVEHLLLSHGEGHHHHAGDEIVELTGIDFPVTLLCTILISLITSAIAFDNQAKLVSIANNFIPSIPSLLPVRFRYRATPYTYPPYLMNLLSNPYTLSPVLFCLAILVSWAYIPAHRHSEFDLILAGIETVFTFMLAYPAAVNLGAVLLQTAPPRGLPGGRMEAFLRAMREIEAHPQVLHLPAPHIWQLTPTLHAPPSSSYPSNAAPAFTREKLGASQNLIVTVDLHIRKDMPPHEAHALMMWANERCRHALKLGVGDGKGGDCEAHVTVGVVRG